MGPNRSIMRRPPRLPPHLVQSSPERATKPLPDRIQGRAVRRVGELLREFQASPAGGRPSKNEDGTDHVSQAKAGKTAGLSERQIKTASAVARVPEAELETGTFIIPNHLKESRNSARVVTYW